MILQRTIDTYAGYYDFDTSGGAIGTIDLGVPIPINTVIIEFGTVSVAACVGVLTTISFDLIITSVSPVVPIIGALMVAQPFTNFAGGYAVLMGTFPGSIPNPPFDGGPAIATSIGMSIAVAPLTAGQIQFWARCISYDF